MAVETPSLPPVYVIKKKKGGHAAHHGGAWKVAYADFVTAMMALFIVLWLLNSSEDVKKTVGGYFLDPTGTGKLLGSAVAGTGDTIQLKKEDLNKVKDLLQQAVAQMGLFKKVKDNVLMTVTGEGLRIELLENKAGMFFESGNAQPSETGRALLTVLAHELGPLPNRILIEGHTDAKPFAASGTYSNWELSADRGNAARRLMEAAGLRPGQVMEIRGFADQDLRNPKDPENASNRRISVIVKFIMVPDTPPEKPGAVKETKAGEHKSDGQAGKPGEAKKPDGKAPEGKSAEGRTPDAAKSEGKASEMKKSDAKSPEVKQPDAKKPESKPAEAKKSEEKKPSAMPAVPGAPSALSKK